MIATVRKYTIMIFKRKRSRITMRKSAAAVIVAFGAMFAGACGGDSTSTESAPRIDVSGRWNYSASNVNGTGVACSISGVTLVLTQSGTRITGNSTGGGISCTINGSSISGALDDEVIVNAKIENNAIEFDIGDADVRNVGFATGTSLSGTVSIRFSLIGGVVPISGPFAAVRQ